MKFHSQVCLIPRVLLSPGPPPFLICTLFVFYADKELEMSNIWLISQAGLTYYLFECYKNNSREISLNTTFLLKQDCFSFLFSQILVI